MYSLLPALVAGLFLGYGTYVLLTKGVNRVSRSFFLLCVTTFFWQATWAVLFQVDDPQLADKLARFGYLLIIFLPTSLYHLLIEIANRPDDRPWVKLSYGFALMLGVLDLTTDLFVAGHYQYFYGYYPKAGPLHALHLVQTGLVVMRGLWVTYQAARRVAPDDAVRLRLCVVSLLIYFFASVDYLCNYGFGFYPPGVVFIAVSLGLIMLAVTRHKLMNPVAVAASVAHEMRTPLATIRLQAETLHTWLPELDRGYRIAVSRGLLEQPCEVPDFSRLCTLAEAIAKQVDRSNAVIDMVLASARFEQINPSEFRRCSMGACVREAIDSYPFIGRERDKVHLNLGADFRFMGAEALMIYVLFNLFKNALYAMKAAGKGELHIELSNGKGQHALIVRDTGSGIPAASLPRIFDTFYTTKPMKGAGLGLPFCRRAVESFGGRIHCESVEGEYTVFHLRFPALQGHPQPRSKGVVSITS
ncbi:sensor histidine kinase [Hydrogenophaga crocea]|uniref:histidine kinase n=1 Tax=Hydrogenophaga crocea TaxID=2716225 RepID=A0A6G8IMH4_9BURK|nr:sensor histidine kinase [Hydrogenophaga crocea]QIM54309.1 hypothetical protein G9Q37_20185 [Hydrogenophaga crocea]